MDPSESQQQVWKALRSFWQISILEEVTDVLRTYIQQDTQETTAHNYKIWTIHDPFEYAPPKPDGDPWLLLLTPLLEKDKIRCDAWKDEVENLLIFAGLFSAVVTAFIIESYKKLQQDPNDVIVNVLTHIARRLDDTLNATSGANAPLIPNFSPTSSTIRINALWFISLVLSLTTVLVGTICLQWLREHQSYPSGSPKQNYAIFNMRKEGLERWHVPRILTLLPLLLQCALILFLVGLIDFLQSLGNHLLAVLIPVSIAICFTLLFLVATMLLPTLQGLYLYFAASGPNAPVQCPYKSPQSHAIRSISSPVFRIFHYLRHRLPKFAQNASRYILERVGVAVGPCPPLKADRFNDRISFCWTTRLWYDFDTNWLELRDLYTQRFYKRVMHYRILGRPRDVLAIYDSISGLQSQNWDEAASLPATYHAFLDICGRTLDPIDSSSFACAEEAEHCRLNAYLQDLLTLTVNSSLADFFVFEGLFHDIDCQTERDNLKLILTHQSIFSFLHAPHYSSSNPLVSLHRAEVHLRLMQHFYRNKCELRSADPQLDWPPCLDFTELHTYYLGHENSTKDADNVFGWQIAQAALLFFRELSEQAASGSLARNPRIRPRLYISMGRIASFTGRVLWHLAMNIDPAVQLAYCSIPTFIDELLTTEIGTRLTSGGEPSLIFYLAALYMDECKFWERFFAATASNDALSTLHRTLRTYKNLTIDRGNTNTAMEDHLKEGVMYHGEQPLWSREWWSKFDNWYFPPDSNDEKFYAHCAGSISEQVPSAMTSPSLANDLPDNRLLGEHSLSEPPDETPSNHQNQNDPGQTIIPLIAITNSSSDYSSGNEITSNPHYLLKNEENV